MVSAYNYNVYVVEYGVNTMWQHAGQQLPLYGALSVPIRGVRNKDMVAIVMAEQKMCDEGLSRYRLYHYRLSQGEFMWSANVDYARYFNWRTFIKESMG